MRKCRQAWLISIPTLLFGVRFGLAQQASKHQARIEKTEYRGWKAYKLTNGIISLFVAPDIGGRAIQLQLGDQEFFFVNKDLAGKSLPESQDQHKEGCGNYRGGR